MEGVRQDLSLIDVARPIHRLLRFAGEEFRRRVSRDYFFGGTKKKSSGGSEP